MAEETEKPQEMIPERDMKALADEADSLMLDNLFATVQDSLGPTAVDATDIPEGDETKDTAEPDLQPIQEMLQVSPERAAQIFAAAQMMPQLQGKSPMQIAEMLMGDMQMRMQIEKLAANAQDTQAEAEADAMNEGGGSMKMGYGGSSMKPGAMREVLSAMTPLSALTGASSPGTGAIGKAVHSAAKAARKNK
mgnify:FL=1